MSRSKIPFERLRQNTTISHFTIRMTSKYPHRNRRWRSFLPHTHNPKIVPLKMRRVLAVCIMSLTLGTIAYSVIRTIAADQSAAPFMSAIAVSVLALLVAFRFVTADQADKGVLVSLYTLLPGLIAWCSRSKARCTVFCGLITLLAAAVFYVGPYSIHEINISTGDSAFVRIGSATIPAPPSGWLSKTIWKPGSNYNAIASSVTCLTAEYREWKPRIRGNIVECGEALAPSLIVNCVNTSKLDTNSVAGRRTRLGVQRVRDDLSVQLPERDVSDRVLVATWNIRDFGRPRMEESLYYVAEVISHFDVVAVQEVQANTEPITRILEILGSSWRVVFSLVSPGSEGNNERMAFFYDRRKLTLGPLLASVVTDSDQPARTPYTATFDVDGRRLVLCSVHILFGSEQGEQRSLRVKEIEDLARFLKQTKQREPEWRGPLILLGDFNAPDATSPEIGALRSMGFYLDADLVAIPSNFSKTRVYD